MRKSFWVVLTLLLLAFLAPGAVADTYTYTFIGADWCAGTNVTIVDTAGPLAFGGYGAPFSSATDLLTVSNGVTSDLGAILNVQFANNFLALNTAWYQAFIQVGGLSDLSVPGIYTVTGGGIGTIEFLPGGGELIIQSSPIATPEPSSIVLLCAAIGVALALRKLIS